MTDPCSANTCDRVKSIHKWSKEEKQALRNLAKWSLDNWPILYHAFNKLTRDLARRGDEIQYDWNLLLQFELRLAELSDQGKHQEAAILFARHLIEVTEQHLGGSTYPEYLQLKDELTRQQLQSSSH